MNTEQIITLENRIEVLEEKLIELKQERDKSKETELLEFLHELYLSLRTIDEKLGKEEIIENLKKYIEDFARNNRIGL